MSVYALFFIKSACDKHCITSVMISSVKNHENMLYFLKRVFEHLFMKTACDIICVTFNTHFTSYRNYIRFIFTCFTKCIFIISFVLDAFPILLFLHCFDNIWKNLCRPFFDPILENIFISTISISLKWAIRFVLLYSKNNISALDFVLK